jgi:glycosyltransferase involved in cell wall biosynthesis
MFHPIIPENIRIHNYDFQDPDQIPESVFDRIKAGFAAKQQGQPLVSVNIIAWNEEQNILRNLSSLSAMDSTFPVEFVYVDNNSNDRTSEIIRKCGIIPVSESRQGYGFARQAALEHSKGEYILTGDADTIYPPTWIDEMIIPVLAGRSVASYGTYSFIPAKGKSRLPYSLYELLRNIIHSLRTIKRPELAVGGVNFCFP